MKKIKKWLFKRRQEKKIQAHANGFGWACYELLMKDKTPKYIDGCLDEGRIDHFDSGALDACSILVDLCAIKEDRV